MPVKRQVIPTVPGPFLPGPPTTDGSRVLAFGLDASVELSCRTGPDGLVTLSVPAPRAGVTPLPGPNGAPVSVPTETLGGHLPGSFTSLYPFQQSNRGGRGNPLGQDCESTNTPRSSSPLQASTAVHDAGCPCRKPATEAVPSPPLTRATAGRVSAVPPLPTTTPEPLVLPGQTRPSQAEDCQESSTWPSTATSSGLAQTWPALGPDTRAPRSGESTDCSDEAPKPTQTPQMPPSIPTLTAAWSTSTLAPGLPLASEDPCLNSSSVPATQTTTPTPAWSSRPSSSSCTDDLTTSTSALNVVPSSTTSLTDCEPGLAPSSAPTPVQQACTNTSSAAIETQSAFSTFHSMIPTTGLPEYSSPPLAPPAYTPPLQEYGYGLPPLYEDSGLSRGFRSTVPSNRESVWSDAPAHPTTQPDVYGQAVPTLGTSGLPRVLTQLLVAEPGTEDRVGDEQDEETDTWAQPGDDGYEASGGKPTGPLVAAATLAGNDMTEITIISPAPGGERETTVMTVQQDTPLPTILALVEGRQGNSEGTRDQKQSRNDAPVAATGSDVPNPAMRQSRGLTTTLMVSTSATSLAEAWDVQTADMMQATPMVGSSASAALTPSLPTVCAAAWAIFILAAGFLPIE